MNPLGKLTSCFKRTAASEESNSDDDTHIESDFELDSFDTDDEIPPPSHIPLPPPGVLPSSAAPPTPTPQSLQADLKAEMCYWSTKYKKDETFRKKIDNFIEFREQVMELKDQGVTSENPDDDPLEPLYQKLGSMLAEAFGMVDPETKDWTPEVKNAANKGGAEYARPSVKSFMWTQAPGILKSTINLYTRIFFGEETASTVRSATNYAFPFVQWPVSIWAAQNNGFEQSEAVQLQKCENPEWSPNVESSKIINEDGSNGELRALRHVLEDLKQLKEMDALIKERDPNKLEQRRRQLDAQMLGAKIKLQEQLLPVAKALRKSQKPGTAPPLNEIEQRILNDELPLEVRIAELSQVTAGRAALPGLARLEAKRLLRQLRDWKMLSSELNATIEAVNAGAPYESIPVRKAVVDTDFERAKVTRYVMLNVLSNQAFVRDIRTLFYGATTATQLGLQMVDYFSEGEGYSLEADAIQVIMGLAQTLFYAWKYPSATGKDALNKFATQWQIIAMTGAGNLIGKNGEVDPTKLDKMVTGKLNTRMGAMGSMLGSDLTVYGQAVLGWLVDPRTVDDDKAEKVKYKGKMIPCTYAVLANEFGKLKDSTERTAFIDAIAPQRSLREGVKEKIDRNLQLYEENVGNLANKGDASKLLGEGSNLPAATREMLRGSLEHFADSGNATRENDELDRALFKRAGKIEQLGELPSQAAQKLGQAFAWLFAGTSGFLFLKALFALAVQALISAGDLTEEGAEKLADAILGGKMVGNAFALAGLVLQLGFNKGYQDYIAKKALHRQNAGGGIGIVNAPPPSLRGSLWQEFLASLGFEEARVEEIMGYETLVGKPIPKEDWPPNLKFLRRTKLTEAMWDQMFAVESWYKNFFAKHGTLEGKTEEKLEKAITENIAAIRKMLATQDGVESGADAQAHPPERSDSHDVRIQVDEVAPAKRVPILDLSPAQGVGNAGPAPEDEQRKPLSPRSFRAKRIEELTTSAARKEGVLKAKPSAPLRRPPVGQTGESRIERHIVRDPDHLWRVDDVPEQEGYDELTDLLQGILDQDPRISKPSKLMETLKWTRSKLGVHVAQTGEHVVYLSPNAFEHANPIQAFSIPDEEGEGLLHISDYKSPSLAVANMLQASLSDNQNLGTLTTEDEFAKFCHYHLPYGPMRVAEMPMQDLAAFTRHMALNDPEANWIPMTTATVRYVPDARERIQSAGTPLPVLQPGKSFGVSYESEDDLGTTLRGSVMLNYDGKQYSVIDPKSGRPIDTLFDNPMEALQWFMREIALEHPNFQPRMTFTVLYHVRRKDAPNNELLSWIGKKNAEALTVDWLDKAATVREARLQVADACLRLEEENSYLLSLGDLIVQDDDKREVANRVRVNREAIELLGGVYSAMTEMDLLVPDY